jgi:hypothetical protein
MLKNISFVLVAFFVVLDANSHATVPRRSVPDAQIVAQAELVASGPYVEIYQHGVVIEASFLKVMESAFLREPIEKLGEAERQQAWAEIERQLSQFEGRNGVEVPGEFLIGAGTK